MNRVLLVNVTEIEVCGWRNGDCVKLQLKFMELVEWLVFYVVDEYSLEVSVEACLELPLQVINVVVCK